MEKIIGTIIYQVKTIEGYDGKYTIDTCGEIRSYHRINTIIRKPHINTSGYLHVRLLNNGKDKSVSLHLLLANAFLPNPDCLPVVNHKDGNKLNNSINNLEWVSHSYNQKHAYNNKLRVSLSGESNPKAKLSKEQVLEIYKSTDNRKELSIKYKVSLSTINTIKNKRQWKSILL